MTDWQALARARALDSGADAIPDDAVARITPQLSGLEAAFTPLLAKLAIDLEPAITLSEGALLAR
jgi:hypothetical protein